MRRVFVWTTRVIWHPRHERTEQNCACDCCDCIRKVQLSFSFSFWLNAISFPTSVSFVIRAKWYCIDHLHTDTCAGCLCLWYYGLQLDSNRIDTYICPLVHTHIEGLARFTASSFTIQTIQERTALSSLLIFPRFAHRLMHSNIGVWIHSQHDSGGSLNEGA